MKSEPYESGLPSDVRKSFRFGVSFYLVAMLFILFDIEVVFLYPIAVQLEAIGTFALVETIVFIVLLRLRSCSSGEGAPWNGSDPLEGARPDDFRVKQLRAQQMLRGDLEGDDLEEYVKERLLMTKFEDAQNWARKNAIWPLGFGLACCAIEMITVIGSPRNDLSRFGAEVIRFSPRQADMLILSGRVSIKMAPIIRRIYDQMLEPKWVISMGACASSAGMFNNYALVAGADKFLPIDVYVPGCPPRPEALIYGIMKLQDKITKDPTLGWRERYGSPRDRGGRAEPGRSSEAGCRAIRSDRGAGCPAEVTHEGEWRCLTQPGSSWSPSACATTSPRRPWSAPTSRTGARPSRWSRSAMHDVLDLAEATGTTSPTASWPACTAATTCPRSRAWASTTSCSPWSGRSASA